MTKLLNGIEYNNPNFPAPFAEYLIHNRFIMVVEKNELVFKRPNQNVFIRGLTLDYFTWDPGNVNWDYKGGFIGLDRLDINGFVMILHSMGIQDLRLFQQNAEAVDHQLGVEAVMFHRALLLCLQPKQKEVVHA